jgi:hypothetical protein
VQLAATLFDGGKRRAQVRLTQAAYDATLANYKQTLLTGCISDLPVTDPVSPANPRGFTYQCVAARVVSCSSAAGV